MLTGGASRITDALELLAAKRGQRLLISGANRSTNAGEIARLHPEFARERALLRRFRSFACNTLGNAIETRKWARAARRPLADRRDVGLSHAARHGGDRPPAARRARWSRSRCSPRSCAPSRGGRARDRRGCVLLRISEIRLRPCPDARESGAGVPNDRPSRWQRAAGADSIATRQQRRTVASARRQDLLVLVICDRSSSTSCSISTSSCSFIVGAADAGDAAHGDRQGRARPGAAPTSGCCASSAASRSSTAASRKSRPGRCWSPPSTSRCGRRSRCCRCSPIRPSSSSASCNGSRSSAGTPGRRSMIPVDRGRRAQALAEMTERARVELAARPPDRDLSGRHAPRARRRAELQIRHRASLCRDRRCRACRSRSIPACSGRAARSCAIPARSWSRSSIRSRRASSKDAFAARLQQDDRDRDRAADRRRRARARQERHQEPRRWRARQDDAPPGRASRARP